MTESKSSKGSGPTGKSADGPRGPAENLGLDPHARSGERSLRPDPKGERDPLGTAHLDPHDRAGDFTLRPDPAGSRDPLARANLDPHGAAADFTPNASGAGLDDVADLATEARDRAAGLADDIQDRIGGAADDARRRAAAAYDDARNWATGVHKQNMQKIEDLTDRSVDGLNRGRNAVEQFVTENPLLVGVVGVAAGLLLGALLPRTRQEDQNIGPIADEVRGQGLRYAREFTSRGKDFVQTALDPDNLNAAARKAAEEPSHAPPDGDRAAHRL